MTIYKNFIQKNKTSKQNLLNNNIYDLPDLTNRLLKSKVLSNHSKIISLDSGLKTPYKALNVETKNLYKTNRLISGLEMNLNDHLLLEYNGITPSGDILFIPPTQVNKPNPNKTINHIKGVIKVVKELRRGFLRREAIKTKGLVLKAVKGGYCISLEGIFGFIPQSRMQKHLLKKNPLPQTQQSITKNVIGTQLQYRVLTLKPFKTRNNKITFNVVVAPVLDKTKAYKPKSLNKVIKMSNSDYFIYKKNRHTNKKLFGQKIKINEVTGFIPNNFKNEYAKIVKLAQVNPITYKGRSRVMFPVK